ncbi:uncharacterized protein BP01DRAFT_380787 [Aspergillus saccharolyticus JOP 1030-1]|uniref:BTB domain-containing protein n=1 Tax=Aspergillus saccharolyticus JOP 1030-1 TaxID=1450539 RepID=A0A318ZUB0_9EURO|nr:hypothetical protein BP01DRAFT_380787 [Aspergillus saccharolyticus JOP 1030-1]PYH47580.1 hypothetical protein BP01DRAFT_380787 [Aspergillus saccharolyticus JOP 1030-1]
MHSHVNRKHSFGPFDDPFVSEALDDFFSIWRPKKTAVEQELKRQRLLDIQADIDQRLGLDSCPPRPPCHSRRQSLGAAMCRFTTVPVPTSNPINDMGNRSDDTTKLLASPAAPKVEVPVPTPNSKDDNGDRSDDTAHPLASPVTSKVEVPVQKERGKDKRKNKKKKKKNPETLNEQQRKRRQVKKREQQKKSKRGKQAAETQPASAHKTVPLSPPPTYASVEAAQTLLSLKEVNPCFSSQTTARDPATIPAPESPGAFESLPSPSIMTDRIESIQPLNLSDAEPSTTAQRSEHTRPLRTSISHIPPSTDDPTPLTPRTDADADAPVVHLTKSGAHSADSTTLRTSSDDTKPKTPADMLFAEREDLALASEKQQQPEEEEEEEEEGRRIREEQAKILSYEPRSQELCNFDPNCCVHLPKLTKCVCPPRKSCCCTHFKAHCQYDPSDVAPEVNETGCAFPINIGENVQSKAPAVEEQKSSDMNKDTDLHQELRTKSSLSAYLLESYHSHAMCDFGFELMTEHDPTPHAIIQTHKIIIARSPSIAVILKFPAYVQGYNQVTAIFSAKSCMIHGFEYALEYMYGGSLLNSRRLHGLTLKLLGYTETNCTELPFPVGTAKAEVAYSYALAGACLQLTDVIQAGIDLTIALISWETIDEILQYGVRPQDYFITLKAATIFDPNPPTLGKSMSSTPGAQDFKNRWAPEIVTACLRFIVDGLKPDFELCYGYRQNSGGPQTESKGQKKTTSADAEDKLWPSYEVYTASWVLSSLPYGYLLEALELLNNRGLLSPSLVHTLMIEREINRLQGLLVWMQEGNSTSDPETIKEINFLGWQERIYLVPGSQESRPKEIQLERKWVGFDVTPLPTSSSLSESRLEAIRLVRPWLKSISGEPSQKLS